MRRLPAQAQRSEPSPKRLRGLHTPSSGSYGSSRNRAVPGQYLTVRVSIATVQTEHEVAVLAVPVAAGGLSADDGQGIRQDNRGKAK